MSSSVQELKLLRSGHSRLKTRASMDTRTSQRTGGSSAGTTFYSGRRPSVDDMPWCTSYADVKHAFRSKDWVHYIVPDVIAASHDPGAFGSDADDFNPYRPRNKGVKSTGIAFGGGVHTCIAMGMAIGDLSGARYDSSEQAGLMVAACASCISGECGLMPRTCPRRAASTCDEYASYWVVFDI